MAIYLTLNDMCIACKTQILLLKANLLSCSAGPMSCPQGLSEAAGHWQCCQVTHCAAVQAEASPVKVNIILHSQF